MKLWSLSAPLAGDISVWTCVYYSDSLAVGQLGISDGQTEAESECEYSQI